MDKRRTEKVPSLADLATSIDQISGDDEITTKLVLKFVTSLNAALEGGGPFDSFYDAAHIGATFWPYASPPEIRISRSAPVSQPVSLRRTIKVDSMPILNRIQQAAGRKMLQSDLAGLGKLISDEINVPLKKKTKQSKARILEWMGACWERIEPNIEEYIRKFKEQSE